MEHIDLGIPEHSYFLGFVHADGNLYETTRNRGKLSIELRECDSDILEEFAKMFSAASPHISRRTRDTNFANNYSTCTLTIHNLLFRQALRKVGMVAGSKSSTISKPSGAIDIDYFRGLIDGDGSLGLTAQGFPFVSLVTISEPSATEYIEFLYKITGKRKTTSRNKRDGAFNIAVYKEDAQALASTLYYDGCLCLQRKLDSTRRVLKWERPASMAVHDTMKPWTDEQDSFILSHSTQECMMALGRSKSSVKGRLRRLSK